MNLVFVSKVLEEVFGSLDYSQLQQENREIVLLEHPVDLSVVLENCESKKTDAIIWAVNDPLGRGGKNKKHAEISEIVSRAGINPARIANVNLNETVITARDSNQAIARLALMLKLADFKLENSGSFPEETTPPVQTIAIIGTPPNRDYSTTLKEQGIDTLLFFNTDDQESINREITDLKGIPGRYLLSYTENNAQQEVKVGGILLIPDTLDKESLAAVATSLTVPLVKKRLIFPENRKQFRKGVYFVSSADEFATGLQTLQLLLEQDKVHYYCESATVDPDRCGMCGTCVKTCMFGASELDFKEKTSVIDSRKCVACGNCVTACPTLARNLPAYPNTYLHEFFPYLEEFKGRDGVRLLVFVCESNGYSAINQIADEKQQIAESCLLMQVRCGARIESLLVAETLRAGFDGVAMLICARNECRNLVGSLDLERRLNLYRSVMKANNIESSRLRIIPLTEGKFAAANRALDQFSSYLTDLQSKDDSIFTM